MDHPKNHVNRCNVDRAVFSTLVRSATSMRVVDSVRAIFQTANSSDDLCRSLEIISVFLSPRAAPTFRRVLLLIYFNDTADLCTYKVYAGNDRLL